MPVSSVSAFGTLGAAQQTVELPIGGYGTIGIQLGGTWTGTVSFEGTVNHGTWVALNATPPNSTTAVTSVTASGVWVASVAGLRVVRVRMSTYGSGTAEAQLLAAGTGGGSGSGGGGGGGGTSSAFGSAFPADGTAAGFENENTGVMQSAKVTDDGEVLIFGTISASSPAVGPTGDPVPAEADFMGFEDPAGNLEGLKAESFDYDSGAGTQAQTAIGIVQPASGGPVPVGPSAPLQVSLANTAANATPVAVSAASLPLPTGAATLAEQQTQTTALQVIDDWDESDRAKVNPIVGQAGVTGGAGAADATTQRVALATDANVVQGAGTAGSASGGVVTVQGVTSMTPVAVSQATAANLNAQVVGAVADDSADGGNPVKVGGQAKAPDGTDPGSVAENDRANAITDLNRRLFVNTSHPAAWRLHLNGSSAYTDQTVRSAPGSGLQTVITSIQVSTGAATAMNLFLEEGSTVIWGPIYLEAVAGRGYVSGPIHLPITANTAVTVTTSANIAQSIDILGFTQAV